MALIEKTIPSDTPGAACRLQYFRFMPSGAPSARYRKIFLQAGLHADEQPGMLILHHLLPMLEAAAAEGRLHAEVVVMPMVNPLGMAHVQFHSHRGRYHPAIGLNYNRGWVDLDAVLADHAGDLTPALGGDAAANRALIRNHLRDWHENFEPVTALDHLRHIVTGEAMDADMVLDLHCDDEALNHIFIVPQLMPEYQDLSDWMGSAATLTAEDSGGGSFDEVWPGLWIKLARRYPAANFGDIPLAATLEYRGQHDVEDDLNRKDAENLYGFLAGRGIVSDDVMPPSPAASPTALNAMELVEVRTPGLVVYRVGLGAVVRKGDVIADLLDLDGDGFARRRTPVCAGTDGVVISRNMIKYVRPGVSIAKIVGDVPLASRGDYLLGD